MEFRISYADEEAGVEGVVELVGVESPGIQAVISLLHCFAARAEEVFCVFVQSVARVINVYMALCMRTNNVTTVGD